MKCRPDTDFLRIRDFLVETCASVGKPLNWRLERWNYARYFVSPMLGMYGQKVPDVEGARQAIRLWEETVGVWEDENGAIVGVVNIEHPDLEHPGFGEAFLQRHPRAPSLLDEMLDYAERTLINPATNILVVYVYDYDEPLSALLSKRGYQKDPERLAYDSEYVVGDLPESRLRPGYLLKSMAEENDLELRRKIFGLAFNHPDPSEWPSAYSYEELQRAPDYRKALDVVIVAPDVEYIACCVAWYDDHNRLAFLEPVGTHPDYRRMGLGREVVMEGIRRVAALGARKVLVGSGQRFYEAIGFEKKYVSYRWTKRFQQSASA